MFLTEKWIIYSLVAAILWGASYAAVGPVLREGMPPLILYFITSLVGGFIAFALLLFRGKLGAVFISLQNLGALSGWFFVSLIASSLGALMTYVAIGEKNASLASLLEISYPLFVVLFSWLFFRELQLNFMTSLGGGLVVVGVAIILFYAK